jgi:hypothetical protein
MLSMLFDELLYSVDLTSPEPTTLLQSDRIKPEFSWVIRMLDMNTGWLLAITCIKEESVRADSQYSWH